MFVIFPLWYFQGRMWLNSLFFGSLKFNLPAIQSEISVFNLIYCRQLPSIFTVNELQISQFLFFKDLNIDFWNGFRHVISKENFMKWVFGPLNRLSLIFWYIYQTALNKIQQKYSLRCGIFCRFGVVVTFQVLHYWRLYENTSLQNTQWKEKDSHVMSLRRHLYKNTMVNVVTTGYIEHTLLYSRDFNLQIASTVFLLNKNR